MVDIIDNLIFMGIAASVIAVMMMLVAWIGRSVFSGMWYQTAWIIVMLLLLIPVYWLIGSIRVRPDAFTNALIPVGFREGYVRLMDRSMGELMGLSSPSVESSGAGASLIFADISSRTMLFIVWGVGVVFLIVWKLIRYYTFRNSIIKKSVPSDERWIFAIPEEIRTKIKLRDAAIPSPFVFGIFRPTVVMPAHAGNKEDICFALMHELLHIERKDLLTKTIAESVAVLHWFNPFAWVIRNKVTLACENACDEAVAAKLNEDGRKGYAMAILDFMDYSAAPEPDYPPTLMSFSGDADHVKTRLKNIMSYKKMSRVVLIVSVCIIMVVISAGILTGFSLALSIQSVRADRENTTTIPAVPNASEPSEGTEATAEPTAPEPTPEYFSYSDELTVISKGEYTIVAGVSRCEAVRGITAVSPDGSAKYSADRKTVAFVAEDPISGDMTLFFSDGEELLEITRNVLNFALSTDGQSLVYKTESEISDDIVSIQLYRADTGETRVLISDVTGSFALSPDAQAVGYSDPSSGSMRILFLENGQTLTPDIDGSIIALSDSGDTVYLIREQMGKPVIAVFREGQTVELLREGDYFPGATLRLILSPDRSGAVLLSGNRAVADMNGKRTVLLENVCDIICSSDTLILGRETLPGGFTVSVEEMRNESAEDAAIFGVDQATGKSKGVLFDFDGSAVNISVPGKVLAASRDGFRILYRSEEGAIYLADDVFDGETGDPIEVSGLMSSVDRVVFAEDRSVYYLTEDGQMLRISETGKPTLIASGVSDFALVSVNGRTELFYLTGYKEELFEANGQTYKRYGRSLFAAKHESITFGRLIDDFVLRVEAGSYGVIYECVTHRPFGSSGCIASVDIFYSTNGEKFTNVTLIG